MKRRNFLKNILPLAAVPLVSNKLFASVLPASAISPEALTILAEDTERVLVLVRLHGGNDGLNTLIPLDQYGKLIDPKLRKDIMLPQNSILKISDTLGFHASMPEMQTLFKEQRLTIIQGVANTARNFSHFHGTDQWESASDQNNTYNSGWIGRYIEQVYPQAPQGYPNTLMPDPFAMEIGAAPSLLVRGSTGTLAQSVPVGFTGQLTQLVDNFNSTDISKNMQAELAFLRVQQGYTNQYGEKIIKAWNLGMNSSVAYPASVVPSVNNFNQGLTTLSQQLKIVARLLKGGIKTRVFVVNIGNFDTHANQGTVIGTGLHSLLLKDLSAAIGAFQKDLDNLGLSDRVIGMTYSEFGRRVASNNVKSTEHGFGAPMFVFGNKVSGTVIGSNYQVPDISALNQVQISGLVVDMQYDYRQVYMSVLRDWFSLCKNDAVNVLKKDVQPVSAFKPGTAMVNCLTDVHEIESRGNYLSATVQPNPSNGSLKIVLQDGFDFSIPVQFTLSDMQGRTLLRMSKQTNKGTAIDLQLNLSPGLYILTMQNGTRLLNKKLIITNGD